MNGKDDNVDLSDLIGQSYEQVGGCGNLCSIVAARAGHYLPPYDAPDDCDEANELFEGVKDLQFVRLDHPEPWCQVAIRAIDRDGKVKWHAGTVLPGCRFFIHVTRKMAVTKTRLNDPVWSQFIEGFYRYGA